MMFFWNLNAFPIDRIDGKAMRYSPPKIERRQPMHRVLRSVTESPMTRK
jgi:hypothetical protein